MHPHLQTNQNIESGKAHAKVCAALEFLTSLGNSKIPRFSGSILILEFFGKFQESKIFRIILGSLEFSGQFQDSKIPRFSGPILEFWRYLGNSKIPRFSALILESWNSYPKILEPWNSLGNSKILTFSLILESWNSWKIPRL